MRSLAEQFDHAPKLIDYELETAARACRGLAHRERQDAAKIDDPALRVPLQKRAESAAALAERFERARKIGPHGPGQMLRVW